ncbi:MAG TPA: cellulase family glycosylhydrolase, partial [Gaiella sp.]|nr:cellulase family glycosylhydrolase [Gaiella sp.]
AGAADRMWVGFQDDPMFRWDPGRAEAMDRARENDARIVRTVVDWSQVAPDRPASATNPFDSAYRFDDVDDLVRNAQQRGMEVLITLWGTPKWANGGQSPQVLPRNMRDFQNFARAVASRYSGRFSGYPYVRFFSIWNESNLATFLRPQFDKKGRIVSARNYARLAKAGYTGIKQGSRSAQVAIGETSSHGRDHPKKGLTDTVAPATFMKGVAAEAKRLKLKFDAWAHHPYPFPVAQKPTQRVRYPNVTLTTMPRFEKDLDTAFKRKNVPVWITEYGNETKPGEPKGVTEAQQAKYLPQAITMARKDQRVQMFIWFVMQDSNGSLWQSGIYRLDGTPKRAQPRFAPVAAPLDPVNGKLTVKGGTKNPLVTVYLREYCANNPTGTTVGYTVRGYQRSTLLSVGQGASPLGIDCTVRVRVNGLTVAKKKTYRVQVAANTATTAEIVRTITLTGV